MNQEEFSNMFYGKKLEYNDGKVNCLGTCTAALYDFEDGNCIIALLGDNWLTIEYPTNELETWIKYFKVME